MVPELAKAHESWLEGELAKAATHKFVFQHIPWFVAEPDEEKIYFNVEPGTESNLVVIAFPYRRNIPRGVSYRSGHPTG